MSFRSDILKINKATLSKFASIQKNHFAVDQLLDELIRYIFFKGNIQVTVKGEHFLQQSKSYVFVANHVTVLSHHKILYNGIYSLPYPTLLLRYILANRLGRRIFHVYKTPGILDLRNICEQMNCILVKQNMTKCDLSNFNMDVQSVLNQGDSISLSPEGRHFGRGCVGPFKNGLYHIASRNSIQIVPIKLEGFYDVYRSITITIGRPESPMPGISAQFYVEGLRRRIFVENWGLKPVSRQQQ